MSLYIKIPRCHIISFFNPMQATKVTVRNNSATFIFNKECRGQGEPHLSISKGEWEVTAATPPSSHAWVGTSLSFHMSHAARKPVFGSSDQVRFGPVLQLESWNVGYSKYKNRTTQAANSKGASQTARMCRLIRAFIVRIKHKQASSRLGSH